MMVTGQWFYRPDEAERKGGGNWQSCDTRELFYSFHRDEVPAESVMHKRVVHFIPLNKQIPKHKKHPGFIVQKVYETEQRRLFKLTFSRLGDGSADQEDQLRNKKLLRRKNMSLLNASREDEETRSGQTPNAETPGSCTTGNTSEYHIILAKALTGETLRDRWLERLLQGIQFICSPLDGRQKDAKENGGADAINFTSSKTANGSEEQRQNVSRVLLCQILKYSRFTKPEGLPNKLME